MRGAGDTECPSQGVVRLDESTLGFVAGLYLIASGINLILAAFLWRRRNSGASLALMSLCLFTAIWNVGYGGALLSTDVDWWLGWGTVQYLGVAGLAASWLLFTLLWTNRRRYVTPWLIGFPLLEGAAVFLLVLIPATRHLIRSAPDITAPKPWFAVTGPLYWAHYFYITCLLTIATGIFLVNLWHQSTVYRRAVVVLTFAAVFPFVVNLAFNLRITEVDLTPIAFTVATVLLTWGVIRQGLIRLAPIAHSQVVAGLPDAVFVLDVFGHVVDSNPAAQRLMEEMRTEGGIIRRQLPSLLEPLAVPGSSQERVRVPDGQREFEVQVNDLPDEHGHEKGRILVVRDITDRLRAERQRTRILAEQARVAATLSRSLRPDAMPVVEGISFAAQYQAARGRELGGDFYDVYRCDDYWAFSLGDVSGKGAPAAAVTALARYTLRALTTSRLSSPPLAVKALNRQILQADDQEKYLTVAHGWCQAAADGAVHVDFVLGGHPLPILVPADASRLVETTGEPGTAVGLLATVELTNTHVVLQPGDALVFFTDGVLEARRGKDFFGEERVVAHLRSVRGAPAVEIASSLMQRTLEFQAGDSSDDTAILVIQAADPYEAPTVQLATYRNTTVR